MREGITLARRETPAVCLLTNKFSAQGDFISRAAGMPEIPRVILPHPLAGTGSERMRQVAETIVDQVIDSLEGGVNDDTVEK